MSRKQQDEMSNSSFLSKIKDGLFRLGDIVLCIAVLASMYFAIVWKLEKILPFNFADTSAVSESSQTNKESQTTSAAEDTETDSDEKTAKQEIESSGSDDVVDNTTPEVTRPTDQNNANTGQPTNPAGDNTTPTPTKPAPTNPVEVPDNQLITVNVPAGSRARDVADILLKKGIITDKNAFLDKVASMKLSGKLLAGDFKLRKNMSHEEMAKILTGQR